MNKRHLLALLLLLSAFSAQAQVSRWFSRYAKPKTESQIVKQYADSLSYYKAQLEELQQQNEQLMAQQGYLTGNPNLYRLFAPATFYHDVAAQQLSLDMDGDGQDADVDSRNVNAALMSIYLDRPDLVVNSGISALWNFTPVHGEHRDRRPRDTEGGFGGEGGRGPAGAPRGGTGRGDGHETQFLDV